MIEGILRFAPERRLLEERIIYLWVEEKRGKALGEVGGGEAFRPGGLGCKMRNGGNPQKQAFCEL